jgi:hypothetical protein
VVATGFYNAWPGYPDQAMFLVYGETGLTKFVQDSNGQWTVAFDVLVNTTADPSIMGAAEGMRVLYDEKEQVYAVSHTVQMKNGLSGTFEFGMTTFTLDGKQKWTRAFPAKSGRWNGVASHPYALSFGSDGSYAIGGLAVNPPDTQGRLVSILQRRMLRSAAHARWRLHPDLWLRGEVSVCHSISGGTRSRQCYCSQHV